MSNQDKQSWQLALKLYGIVLGAILLIGLLGSLLAPPDDSGDAPSSTTFGETTVHFLPVDEPVAITQAAETEIFADNSATAAEALLPLFGLYCENYHANDCADVLASIISLGDQLTQVQRIVDATRLFGRISESTAAEGKFRELAASARATANSAEEWANTPDLKRAVLRKARLVTERSEYLIEYKQNWCGDLEIPECK